MTAMPATRYDLSEAIRLDPHLTVQREIALIRLKWGGGAFVIVALLAYWSWRAGGVAPSIPDLILFVPIAGGTVILTALSAYLLLKGPRPRRLPNELILAGDGFRLCYPDGGEVSVSWGKENLWLQLSKPGADKVWDPVVGALLPDERGGAEGARARQRRKYGGMPTPPPWLRIDGKDAMLTGAAINAILESAKAAGCRIKSYPGPGEWDLWLVQEPLIGHHFWKD